MDSKAINTDYIRAGSDDVSAEDLQILASSEITAVRRRVAENEKTPEAVLASLAKDKSAEVRMSVASNKSTPMSIVTQLASDENADVRHLLASTSYVPKHLLRQLADDANPHVAQRAKIMLAGLESKVGRMVSVFEFLSEDHAALVSQLKVLIEKYFQWSHDKVFEETVDVLDGIRRHLDRQRRLCLEWINDCAPETEVLQGVLRRSAADQEAMLGEISELLMQHVDGPDFLPGLEKLLKRIQEHCHFTESELFAEIKKHVPPEELDAINLRLSKSLLRGESI
jgi:hypothetical protein